MGIILLLNTVYLYPDGGGDGEMTYYVDKIENESAAEAALLSSEQVLNCPGARECIFEEEILEEGSIEYNGSIDRGPSYPVIQHEEDVYIPESNINNGTTEFTLRETSNINAIPHAAIPAEDRPPEVKEAVKTGSTTVYDERVETFERGEIIEYENEYYFRTGTLNQPAPWIASDGLIPVRIALFAIGSGLVFYAGKRLNSTAG